MAVEIVREGARVDNLRFIQSNLTGIHGEGTQNCPVRNKQRKKACLTHGRESLGKT